MAMGMRMRRGPHEIKYTEDEWRILDATDKIQLVVTGFALVGVVGLLLWSYAYGSLQDLHPKTAALQTFGIFSLIACAAAAAGALFGFLFGIPRTREAERAATLGDDPGNMRQAVLAANTNLERVSDWLTTLLLGATLVQLDKIVAWIGKLGTNIKDHPNETVTTVVVVYFVVLGFLGTYLVTRLYLTYAMQRTMRGPVASRTASREQQPKDALQAGDANALDLALQAYEHEQSRTEIADDPEVSLLVARVAGKRIKLGGLDAETKSTRQKQLLKAWGDALANPQVKSRLKANDAERKEFEDLDAEIKGEIDKALQ